MFSKPILFSKTFWFGLITAILPLFPEVAAEVSANPQIVMSILGGVSIVLRWITKDEVTLK